MRRPELSYKFEKIHVSSLSDLVNTKTIFARAVCIQKELCIRRELKIYNVVNKRWVTENKNCGAKQLRTFSCLTIYAIMLMSSLMGRIRTRYPFQNSCDFPLNANCCLYRRGCNAKILTSNPENLYLDKILLDLKAGYTKRFSTKISRPITCEKTLSFKDKLDGIDQAEAAPPPINKTILIMSFCASIKCIKR